MISVIVTVGDLAPERREPVVSGIRQNLENAAVDSVHVLTEGSPTWLPEALGALAEHLHLEPVAKRPTFGTLFDYGNRLLESGAASVAIMNADISIASAEDVRRLQAGLVNLSTWSEPVVFALARHEQSGGGRQIEVFEEAGVPNYISADAWVFRTPIHPKRELFYCPGQMNCDMFLAYDLIASGYAVFNPCLDVTILHHEPAKDDAFYKEKNEEAGVLNLLERHMSLNSVQPFNYSRIPWVSTEWLKAGYRPRSLHTNQPTILLSVGAGYDCPDQLLLQLAQLCEREGRECQILCEGDLVAFYKAHAEVLARSPGVTISPTNRPLAEVRETLLQGKQYSFNSVAFVHDLSCITPQLLAEAEGIFVSTPEIMPAMQDDLGCSLVTSVFRSDDFLQGFINNSKALEGYGQLIDHIFLIAAVSEKEARLLNGLLEEQPNVMVFWNRQDPGLYNCWNQGIRLARRRYISNANVDDLRDPAHVISLIRDLESHPDVLVAASAMNPFYDFPADGRLPDERPGWYSDRPGRFSMFDLGILSPDEPSALAPHNMPHCMPVWRRDLHDRYGWFNEAHYGTYADWAFWMKTLRDGAFGWLNPEPLGFYFVNPTSHNRRGTDLDRLHGLVEAEFLPMFLARRDGHPLHASRKIPETTRKLNLSGSDLYFGEHRNSFNRIIHALNPLARENGEGVLFVPFLERYFVWGSDPGEAASETPQPIWQDWVGILHVPFDAPEWFNPDVSPEIFFDTDLWRASRPHCRGIITLAEDLAADLKAYDPEIPVLSVRHPVDMDVQLFDPAAYRARPRVVQAGDWLRKLQAIHRLKAPDHERIMLLKAYTENFLEHEVSVLGDARDPAVDMRRMVPNEEYDQLLSSSVVLCLLYATAANNLVIECIARATPILINPLPAVVEYLGHDYPLYVSDEEQAAQMLAEPDRVEQAHHYLLERRKQIDLSYTGFCRDIVESEWYARL